MADAEKVKSDGDKNAAGDAQSAGQEALGLMQNPQVLAALQDRLDSMVGLDSGYIKSLPKVVRRRLKALKKLQFDAIKIESKFYEELHELECKYAVQYQPLLERRREIVTGGLEPTDSDCDWPSDEEDVDEEELAKDMQSKAVLDKEDTAGGDKADTDAKDAVGVPNFWFTIFKNVDLLEEMVQEYDEPILKHLQDVKLKLQQANPMGFSLEFHFEPNEYFTNTVLTKEYELRSEPDKEDPLSYDGPEIVKCKGCEIDWNKGKNVTVKLIKKTQKHKGRGTKRTVTKQVQTDSFFNFFNPPEANEDEEEEEDEDTEQLLAADYEIGHFLREQVIPRAVLYFTGEAVDNDMDEEDDDEGNEEDDEEYDEDGDPDYQPKPGEKPAECKQQ